MKTKLLLIALLALPLAVACGEDEDDVPCVDLPDRIQALDASGAEACLMIPVGYGVCAPGYRVIETIEGAEPYEVECGETLDLVLVVQHYPDIVDARWYCVPLAANEYAHCDGSVWQTEE